MALYYYTKEVNIGRRKFLTMMSYASMTIGALFLFWSFYPIVAFEIYSRIFISNKITNPIAQTTSTSLSKAQRVKGSNTTFSTNLVDFTKASAWFPESYASGAEHKKRYNPLLKLYMYHVQDLKGEKGFMFVLYCGEIIHKKSTIKYGNTMATYEMMRQEGLLEVEMMHQKLKEEVALMALDGW
jgi:hypothetical protein